MAGLLGVVELQRQGGEALALHHAQPFAAFGNMLLRGRAALLGVGRVIGCAVQTNAGCQLAQHGGLADAAALHIMGFLLGSQHLQALACQRFCGQQGRGRGLGVQRRANVIEQAVEIGIAKRLARHLGNALVAGHDFVTPVRSDGARVGSGQHAAGMPLNLDAGHLARGLDQRGGGIAPAAQGIENIVQHQGGQLGCVHIGRPCRPVDLQTSFNVSAVAALAP